MEAKFVLTIVCYKKEQKSTKINEEQEEEIGDLVEVTRKKSGKLNSSELIKERKAQ
jgi:hypothetical protein